MKNKPASLPPTKKVTSPERRSFLGTMGAFAVGGMVVPVLPGSGALRAQELPEPEASVAEIGPLTGKARLKRAYQIRKKAASAIRDAKVVEHKNNGDEDKYPNRIANYTKGLPHNNLGEVDLSAYNALLKALGSGKTADFEAIPLGGSLKFENPQAGLVYEMQGADQHQLTLAPAPTFDSAEQAAEMVENYWMALVRDIPFSEYDSNPLAQAAANELSGLSGFRGPKENGKVTANTLFRGIQGGNGTGPYVSQFLLKDVPYPAERLTQRIRTLSPG